MKSHWLYSLLAILALITCSLLAACDNDEEDCDCPNQEQSDDDDNDDNDDNDNDDSDDPQQEITELTPLLNADGSLNARGWARRPLMVYDPESVADINRFRVKEWDAYLIISPDFMFGVTVADIQYASFISFELIDFATEKVTSGLELHLGSLGFLPTDLYGAIDYDLRGNQFHLDYNQGVRTITAGFGKDLLSPSWEGEITLTQDPDEEDIAAAAPYPGAGTFFYENKIVGMRASGHVTVDGKTYTFDPVDSMGYLDWVRGVIPHITEWHWGVAAGTVDGELVGFNIGDGMGENDLGTANAMKMDGVLHKMYHVYFDYDRNAMMKPWLIDSDSGNFDMTLTPFFHQKIGMMVLDLGMLVDKAYGRFSGTMTKDDGTVVEVKNLIGFVEWSNQRW